MSDIVFMTAADVLRRHLGLLQARMEQTQDALHGDWPKCKGPEFQKPWLAQEARINACVDEINEALRRITDAR